MNVVADLDSSTKKLLTLAVDGAALVAVGVLVAILLLKAFRPARFALMPFVVAPDLDPKLAAVARRSLQMELARGAVAMSEPHPDPWTIARLMPRA